jgi:hypothetical protein
LHALTNIGTAFFPGAPFKRPNMADWSFEGVGEPKARRASARGRFLVVEITTQGVAALWLVKFACGLEKCRAEYEC